MKLRSLLLVCLACLCVMAVRGAPLALTNVVTLNIVMIPRGSTNTSFKGTNTFFEPAKTESLNTAQLLQRLAKATGQTNGFSPAAKLMTFGGEFTVVDGSNVVYLDPTMMYLYNFGDATLMSGVLNPNTGAGVPSLTKTTLGELHYDDTSVLTNGGLQFYLEGLEIAVQTDSALTSSNTYHETLKIKSTMTGEGWSNGGAAPFVATGSFNANGSGELSPLP